MKLEMRNQSVQKFQRQVLRNQQSVEKQQHNTVNFVVLFHVEVSIQGQGLTRWVKTIFHREKL